MCYSLDTSHHERELHCTQNREATCPYTGLQKPNLSVDRKNVVDETGRETGARMARNVAVRRHSLGVSTRSVVASAVDQSMLRAKHGGI